MIIQKIIVDHLPEGCDSCPQNFCDESNRYCVALIREQYTNLDLAKLPYGMYNFRRHDCPLVLPHNRESPDNELFDILFQDLEQIKDFTMGLLSDNKYLHEKEQ